jgi:hypothetical protein
MSGYRRVYHAGGLALSARRFKFDLMQETHESIRGDIPPGNLCALPMTCLKNLGTYAFRVCGHSAIRGAVTRPVMLSKFSPAHFLATGRPLFNVRA